MYQNLSTRHDWPVQKVIFDFPSRLQGTQNALPIICESVGAQNKYIGAASQALDLLKSCFRSVCLLVPTSSLAFPRFAFGAHAVDLHRSLSLVAVTQSTCGKSTQITVYQASTSMDRLQVWYRHFSLFFLFLLIYFYYINFKKVTSFFSGNKQSGLRGKISCLN